MRLTKFTDYSLRVVIYLARHPDSLATIADIAREYDIPSTHLMKVVHRLAQCGYILTVRGKGGGMRLARTPDLINVGDLVRDTEDNMDIAECFSPDHQSCPMLPACALKSVLVEARKSFLATLDFYRLSDIMGGATPSLVAPLHQAHGTFAPPSPGKKKRTS
ncbi:MAG: RrF2 family transcriptional regulator [Thiobacillus sp.]|nr:RrF2 family transcriptional regulator [Thiobacillus sp.]